MMGEIVALMGARVCMQEYTLIYWVSLMSMTRSHRLDGQLIKGLSEEEAAEVRP